MKTFTEFVTETYWNDKIPNMEPHEAHAHLKSGETVEANHAYWGHGFYAKNSKNRTKFFASVKKIAAGRSSKEYAKT